RAALTTAIRARDAAAVAALRSALAAIDNAESVSVEETPRTIDTGAAGPRAGAAEAPRRELAAAEIVALVRAELTERQAAADEYERLGRPDRVARLRAEAEVLARFLPVEAQPDG